MKILHVSNFYYNRGGDCTHLFSLMDLLKSKGHKNMVFSMHHPQNFDSEYSDYFIKYINYADELKKKNLLSALKIILSAVYSSEAKKNINNLIKREKPDIAHIQSLHHHITHSVLYPLKKSNIPVIWTLHDFALICPNTLFLCRGEICEKCKKAKYFWPLIKQCKKDSLGASLVAAVETIVHRVMKVSDMVDIFITPSEFLRNKLIEYGFNKNKIICINNFIDFKIENNKADEGYYLYAGRLTKEKGIKTLIDASVKAKAGVLKIVGDGPLRDEMESYVKSGDNDNKIEFLGHKEREEVINLLKKCKFVVVPSEWYENFPYAILEAFACGKPVIGSRIGGIAEMINENKTGLTFEPGSSDDLISRIEYLVENPSLAAQMGSNAKVYVEQSLNADMHYKKLLEIYKSVLKN